MEGSEQRPVLVCDDGYDDDDGSCFACGGSGVLDDWCECQRFEDVCCCLNPEPQTCDECGGAG